MMIQVYDVVNATLECSVHDIARVRKMPRVLCKDAVQLQVARRTIQHTIRPVRNMWHLDAAQDRIAQYKNSYVTQTQLAAQT